MAKINTNLRVDNKKLIRSKNKKEQQKYLILLSNDVVIINEEFTAMKIARRYNKPIRDMLPTNARLINQVTVLSKLLEALDGEKETI